ncbi:MAG: LON peptidase substrate-binding domain-containing protein, partial [Clostridia bacterium]|nr:LON peptidase substrate-binding domain-containing protein [Clostridia bacterium]
MPKFFERIESLELPLIPLRGLVAFPNVPINFELSRDISLNACQAALKGDTYALLISQRDPSTDNPTASDLFKTGCIAKIKHTLKTPDGNLRVIAEGVCRGVVTSVFEQDGYMSAEVMSKMMTTDPRSSDVRAEALIREANETLKGMLEYMPAPGPDVSLAMRSVKSPGALADFIAAGVLVRFEDKQQVLECVDPMKRLELVTVFMESETKLLKTEMQIHKKVKEQIDDNQREYYLKEQLKIIQGELGLDTGDEVSEYLDRIEKTVLPEEVKTKLLKEVNRLSKTPFGSPEATVSRNYLDVCLDIPWGKKTPDSKVSVQSASKVLEADHEGLSDIKERILEYVAVKKLNPDLKNQILCFVGPPGVGKTSLGKSVARAMKRKYARISLGGVRDESDIRGHRKTYIGSMPGRIIDAIIDAGVMNPLIQLDEIDKLGQDIHGDPASALLEVLDSEQNKAFRDHFIEIPVDLSDCIFIATANTLETVPAPLIDRMEIIEMHT